MSARAERPAKREVQGFGWSVKEARKLGYRIKFGIGDENSEWKRYCERPEEGCSKWLERLKQNYRNQNK